MPRPDPSRPHTGGRPPTPPEKLQQVRELIAEGSLGRNEISRRTDIAKHIVSRLAKEMGHSFADRTKTETATRTRQADNAKARADLQADLLADAARLREQLWQPSKAFNFGGRDNTYAEVPLDEPVFADKLRILQAAGAAIDRSIKLAELDAASDASREAASVDQWLNHMTGG